MKLILIRSYYPTGTNGAIFLDGVFQCFSIELPWLHNQHRISCIPEGAYLLRKRINDRFGSHLLVDNVPARDCILIHPANDAVKELRGCIAPVSMLTGPGLGLKSKVAAAGLYNKVSAALKNESVYLEIVPRYT